MANSTPSPAPVVLAANSLHIRITEKLLCDHQDLVLREGDRVGMIGRNGAGKSTILRVLSGEETHYGGDITTRRELRASYLAQEAVLAPGKTVRECIIEGARDILEMIHRLHDLPADSREATQLDARITACDGWRIDHNLEVFATSLDAPDLERVVDHLSGGEKRRVALCRALVSHPDLLVLDEPTNHLDTESIEWLESFLARYSGTCLFVTHDRQFLDRVATRMLELSFGKLADYVGNYSAFLHKKAERQSIAEKQESRRLSFIRREADWIHRGPKARATKAQYRVDRYYDALNQAPVARESDVDIIIPPAHTPGNVILEMQGLGISLGGKELIRNFGFVFEAGMRIGVVGRNGLGKTTLLKLMLGTLEPTDGHVRTGERTQFNYADQHRVLLNGENTVFEEVGEGKDFVQLGNSRISLWAYLKRFLFTDEEIHTRVDQLSGGERSRIVLAKILKWGGNFLMLDEPTNDLDLATLRVLEEALTSFGGCVVVVSHDRYFLNRVCTGIIGFEGDTEVVYQEGDYDYYVAKKRERQAKRQQETAPAITQPQPQSQGAAGTQKLKWKEERELEGIEERILEAETTVEALQELFMKPDFFQQHGHELQELQDDLEAKQEEVHRLYARWEELEAIRSGQ